MQRWLRLKLRHRQRQRKDGSKGALAKAVARLNATRQRPPLWGHGQKVDAWDDLSDGTVETEWTGG